MWDKCKYIMINESDPIIFPASWKHDTIAGKFKFGGIEIISAGFVNIHKGMNDELVVNAYSESKSLKLESKEIDSLIIKSLLVNED
jgi:hypothetical protein